MIGVALGAIVIGIIALFVFPWVGVPLAILGLILLVLFLLGIGRSTAQHER